VDVVVVSMIEPAATSIAVTLRDREGGVGGPIAQLRALVIFSLRGSTSEPFNFNPYSHTSYTHTPLTYRHPL
jgi:hypothetical protein